TWIEVSIAPCWDGGRTGQTHRRTGSRPRCLSVAHPWLRGTTDRPPTLSSATQRRIAHSSITSSPYLSKLGQLCGAHRRACSQGLGSSTPSTRNQLPHLRLIIHHQDNGRRGLFHETNIL